MSKVHRRLVLYLSGFDPRGVRYYHQLYRAEAQAQANVSGYRIEVSKRERVDEHLHQWNVRYTDDTETVDTDYVYAEWDDIVRQFWVKQPARLAWVTLTASWRALRSGVFAKTFQWSWPAGVTATMPAILILILLLVSIGFGGIGYGLFGIAGAAVGFAAGAALLWLAYRLEQKFNLTWVGRILSFHEREEQSRTHVLDQRRDVFGTYLRDKLADPSLDEILVVGHSYGAALAMAVVARALDSVTSAGPKLSLLTLGQTIMWLAWLPEAKAMRQEIAAVAESDEVDWLDISAPPDGACFALVDPYTAIGDRNAERRNPKLLNAKFHEIMPKAEFDRKSRDWMRLHFQYIMATAQPADYDFFAITAGAQTLADRFAHRPSVRDFTRLRRGRMKQVR
jgi:pimeloyl-ACP methyl ester carboxylesterase